MYLLDALAEHLARESGRERMENIVIKAETEMMVAIGASSDKGFSQYKKWRGKIQRDLLTDEPHTDRPTVWAALRKTKGVKHGI